MQLSLNKRSFDGSAKANVVKKNGGIVWEYYSV